MINKEKLKNFGITLSDYLEFGLISADSFFVPKSILNLNEAFSDPENGKDLLFKSLALTVFQTINNLLMGLPEKFEQETYEAFKNVVGELNAENLRRAVFEEIKFRTFNNQWPEFTNRTYLSNGLQKIGDNFKFNDGKNNLLSSTALTYLQNSNWDDFNEILDVDYLKNILTEYIKKTDISLIKDNLSSEILQNNEKLKNELNDFYNEFNSYKNETLNKLNNCASSDDINNIINNFNDYKQEASNSVISKIEEIRQDFQNRISEINNNNNNQNFSNELNQLENRLTEKINSKNFDSSNLVLLSTFNNTKNNLNNEINKLKAKTETPAITNLIKQILSNIPNNNNSSELLEAIFLLMVKMAKNRYPYRNFIFSDLVEPDQAQNWKPGMIVNLERPRKPIKKILLLSYERKNDGLYDTRHSNEEYTEWSYADLWT